MISKLTIEFIVKSVNPCTVSKKPFTIVEIMKKFVKFVEKKRKEEENDISSS